MKRVAIVILNWNGKHWLQKFLPNVLSYSQKEAEIYVIDNASTDDSCHFLENHFPQINTIRLEQNLGFAGGYNEGLKQIEAEIFCLLNSDVEVTLNWIAPILQLFDSQNDISVIQPKILSYNNKNYFEFAGAGGGFIDNLGYPYCRGRIFDKIEKDNGQYNDTTEIFWASGCAMFIRSIDFFAQNGFDARFFAHQEEIDLCWRLKNTGRKVYYNGQSVVYHFGGGTLNKQNPRKTYLNFRNNLSMLLKNLPLHLVFPIIFLRLWLDGIAAIRFAMKDGFSHLWAIAQAHFAFYSQIPNTLRRRQKRQIRKYYQAKWIVFKYFMRKS